MDSCYFNTKGFAELNQCMFYVVSFHDMIVPRWGAGGRLHVVEFLWSFSRSGCLSCLKFVMLNGLVNNE